MVHHRLWFSDNGFNRLFDNVNLPYRINKGDQINCDFLDLYYPNSEMEDDDQWTDFCIQQDHFIVYVCEINHEGIIDVFMETDKSLKINEA